MYSVLFLFQVSGDLLMKPFLGWVIAFTLSLGLVFGFTPLTSLDVVHAAPSKTDSSPPGPDRFTSLTIEITLYEWWVIGWSDNHIYCSFYADHEGLPNDNDILSACGEDIYVEWKAYSTPCAAEDIHACPGYYVVNISSKPATREIAVKLPPPQIWVSVENCNPDPDGWCSTQPSLILSAEEPLPGESITSIHGFAGNDPFECRGDRCQFSLHSTTSEGVNLQFWAYSTYGDSSESFSALVRVLTQGGGDDEQRLVKRWYVDVLSTQWTGSHLPSCSITWDAFPPTEGLPTWLTTPATPASLTSNIPYAYLAGKLISQGTVDVSACPDQGLNENGSATACGMEAARPTVEAWQNQFDTLIFDIATKTDVPAQLLKNLFSRESQFWPGIAPNTKDAGLGQLTENGADTVLLWNRAFFEDFCPLVLDQAVCQAKAYTELELGDQKLLRGALVASVNATCEKCPLGIDVNRANFSVAVFGRTLLANCEQAGKIVKDVTGYSAGRTLGYEDLWRLTLVNYNAGPGCLAEAVNEAYQPGIEPALSWESISQALDPACQGAIGYVEDISKP